MKRNALLAIVAAIVILGIAFWIFSRSQREKPPAVTPEPGQVATPTPGPGTPPTPGPEVKPPPPPKKAEWPPFHAQYQLREENVDIEPSACAFTLSPDRLHAAWLVNIDPTTSHPRKLVVDGVDRRTANAMGYPCFTPDSLRFACMTMDIHSTVEYRIFIDCVTSPGTNPSGELVEERLAFAFSPDSRHFACVFNPWSGGSVLWVDGRKQSPGCQEAERIVYSPDSKRMAWVARVDKDRFPVLFLDSERHQLDGWVVEDPFFSPDSKRVAVITEENRQRYFVLDGKKMAEWDGVARVCFSPDSKRIAGSAYVDLSGMRMVVDGKPDKAYEKVFWSPGGLFSPDSSRVAYIARQSYDHYTVVADGKESGTFTEVGALAFSPDSKHLAYGGRIDTRDSNVIGRGFLTTDGTKQSLKDQVVEIAWSPDSRHLAYTGETPSGTDRRVVLDGNAGRTYQGTGELVFSPDSRHLAYVAVTENRSARLVVDGREYGPWVKPFEGFVQESDECRWSGSEDHATERWSRPVFDDKGGVSVLMMGEKKMVRVHLDLLPAPEAGANP